MESAFGVDHGEVSKRILAGFKMGEKAGFVGRKASKLTGKLRESKANAAQTNFNRAARRNTVGR